MAFWKLKLAQIESRLQGLVEGGVARLWGPNKRFDLASRLVESMRQGIRPQADGSSLAPNLYLLWMNPDQARALTDSPALLENLSYALREAGAEAGLAFFSPPILRVSPSGDIDPGELRVEARHSQDDLTQTSDVEISITEDPAAIPSNAFLIVDGTRIVPLTQAVVNIGRRKDNQVVVDDLRVSRVHAQLRAIRGRYVIFDLNSLGGTLVNGEPIHQSPLFPGDVIILSGIPLVFGQDTPQDEGFNRPGSSGDTNPLPPLDAAGKPRL